MACYLVISVMSSDHLDSHQEVEGVFGNGQFALHRHNQESHG